MEALVANIVPNITSVQKLDNVTRCTAQSSVPSSRLPYSDLPRLSLVDKARVIGQIQAGYTKKWMAEFVSGVDQENVVLGQHAAHD